MDDNDVNQYPLDDDRTVPPSPPVDVLHLHVKYADDRGADAGSQDNLAMFHELPHQQVQSPTHLPAGEHEYFTMEDEEEMETDTTDIAGLSNEFTFVKYGPMYPAAKKRNIHLEFKQSEMFQVHKAETDFDYMRTHETLKCSEVGLTEAEKAQLMDIIRTPIEFEDKDGNHWQRRMSLEAAPISAAEELHQALEDILQERKARRDGICPIRRAIYEDCFDELHRQIVVDHPDSGILLQRCRQEIAHTFDVMTHLFGSSYAYIMRQTAMDMGATKDLEQQVAAAREEKNQLAKVYANLLHRAEGEEDRLENEKSQERDRMDKELEFLKTTENRLRNVLNRFMNIHMALRDVAAIQKPGAGGAGGNEGKGDGG